MQHQLKSLLSNHHCSNVCVCVGSILKRALLSSHKQGIRYQHRCFYTAFLLNAQDKVASATREAEVLEIKRQGQLKALEAQRAKKEVGL